MSEDNILNTAVAIVFFNRPEPLKQVFEAVSIAKPSKLFLIQDGERNENKEDKNKIQQCRKIVEQVTWECEIYKNYSLQNLSCDHREFTGLDWAFNYVDRLIILEDDCVPSQSFFHFCDELLEKYKNDERISMICGMNHLGEYNKIKSSYFFSEVGAGCGWATWKRVWTDVQNNVDLQFIENEEVVQTLDRYLKTTAKGIFGSYVKKCYKIKRNNEMTDKISSWEMLVGNARLMYSRVAITPAQNLICNIGLTDDATHGANNIKKLPKAIQNIFFMPARELKFPLIHPKYMIRDIQYEQLYEKIMAFENPLVKISRRIEGIIRKIIYSTHSERKQLLNLFLKRLQSK